MMTYTYDVEENVIHLHASGILVKDDPISYFHSIAQDTTIKPQAVERVYFQKLDNIAFTYIDIQQIRDTFNALKHHQKLSYTVFVTDSDFTYGMARMIISIFDHPDHEFKVIREDQ